METAELLDRLGYQESENYLRKDRGDFDRVVDYGHLFRRAAKEPCRLQGVYTLSAGGKDRKGRLAVPVVYVCDVSSEEHAKEIHGLVWNQDTVPFLIVNSPDTVRVYPGFCHGRTRGTTQSMRRVLQAFSQADVDRIARTLNADEVDKGRTWDEWGPHIVAEHRIDRQLLGNLKKLDAWLRQQGLERHVSHALIGKYVYLYYLRHRDILSDRKLDKWRVPNDAVFGPKATAEGLRELVLRLDDWLNGEVFPIDLKRRGAPKDEHIARVAATFEGAQPLGARDWQLHLDFQAYDFSYIPIEVLSMVYEQFLHASEKGSQDGRRSAGAYYTPIPVVNFMLSELEERRPLRKGMRVFDPACGSGAFLVQAFRRLIETEYPPPHGRPSVPQLRELLENHFFGLDTDEGACRVARLSLILTLLDYVEPPDLEVEDRPGPNPRLPDLRENIMRGNFFDERADWQQVFARKKADWVVGNPPWKQLKKGKTREIRAEDRPVLEWMKANEKDRPVGNRQMARAFAWRVAEYVDDRGEVALFLPAMSLFEEEASRFRSRFFGQMQIHTIANFSNLRWVISARRFTAPAAAFFYRPRPEEVELAGDEHIRTYCPLVANQEATRPKPEAGRNETWSIVVNASEIRDVPLSSVIEGNGLPWKIALWGSELDAKLIRRLRREFPTIGDLEGQNILNMNEGPQLRRGDPKRPPDGMEAVPHLLGRRVLRIRAMKGLRDCFALPPAALAVNDRALLRLRGGRQGLAVCEGPHVIVSAARNFAVYCKDFLIVPPRQIGIVSLADDTQMLRALSLFLSSDFAFYFEFFASTEFGVERGVSTLKALRSLPIPLLGMTRRQTAGWAKLHDRLAQATREAFQKKGVWEDSGARGPLPSGPGVASALLRQLNALVYEELGLAEEEQALVHDLVNVRLALNDGALGREAIRPPTTEDMRSYGTCLKTELDQYISGAATGSHGVQVVHDDHSGMVRVQLAGSRATNAAVAVVKAGAQGAEALDECRNRVRKQRSQWVYFDRNLRAYEGAYTYVLKPMQRFHWTRTQARIDAMDIVAESMARGRGK